MSPPQMDPGWTWVRTLAWWGWGSGGLVGRVVGVISGQIHDIIVRKELVGSPLGYQVLRTLTGVKQ